MRGGSTESRRRRFRCRLSTAASVPRLRRTPEAPPSGRKKRASRTSAHAPPVNGDAPLRVQSSSPSAPNACITHRRRCISINSFFRPNACMPFGNAESRPAPPPADPPYRICAESSRKRLMNMHTTFAAVGANPGWGSLKLCAARRRGPSTGFPITSRRGTRPGVHDDREAPRHAVCFPESWGRPRPRISWRERSTAAAPLPNPKNSKNDGKSSEQLQLPAERPAGA